MDLVKETLRRMLARWTYHDEIARQLVTRAAAGDLVVVGPGAVTSRVRLLCERTDQVLAFS